MKIPKVTVIVLIALMLVSIFAVIGCAKEAVKPGTAKLVFTPAVVKTGGEIEVSASGLTPGEESHVLVLMNNELPVDITPSGFLDPIPVVDSSGSFTSTLSVDTDFGTGTLTFQLTDKDHNVLATATLEITK